MGLVVLGGGPGARSPDCTGIRTWIWRPRSISPDYHDQVVACCRAAGFAPDARHVARSITSQLAMVDCGLGVALVPEGAAHRPDDGVRFLRASSARRPSSSPPSGAARPTPWWTAS
jgi:DNA-binding transcriptional LysR family regulator